MATVFDIEYISDSFLKLAKYFSSKYHRKIGQLDIMEAILILKAEEHDMESILDVWDLEYTYEEYQQLLEDFDFSILFDTIDASEYLPTELVFYSFKQEFKQNGSIFIVHANDNDPFPSKPHAHLKGTNLKLNLSNGVFYKKSQPQKEKLSKKKLLKLREEISIKTKHILPKLAIGLE